MNDLSVCWHLLEVFNCKKYTYQKRLTGKASCRIWTKKSSSDKSEELADILKRSYLKTEI
jgi:hypothetical protein